LANGRLERYGRLDRDHNIGAHLMLSVVIPVHDEEENVRELERRLALVLDRLDEPSEVIFVDDGSRDATYPLLLGLNSRAPRFKVVRLSRNFGHQMAITAGTDLAAGDAVVIMDGDLQHPPELIPEFVRWWRAGYDVVYGVMEERPEGWFKRTTAQVFYRVLRWLAHIDVTASAGDFRLVSRRALAAFNAMPETKRYVRGMFSWIGFRQIAIPYVCEPRHAGHTSYTFPQMLKLAADGIFSFSTRPLRIVLGVGLLVSLFSFLFGIASIASKYAGAYAVPGWLTIVVVMSFIGGVILFVLGVTGVYIGRIYDEVKQRPLYFVQDLHGFDVATQSGRMPVRNLDNMRRVEG
jgi:glycosyltransferase involved in cell wall biosynthesis